ncbi:MAG: hypothetical protein ACREN0_06190 [Thermodesulfobacteriota bacterium]
MKPPGFSCGSLQGRERSRGRSAGEVERSERSRGRGAGGAGSLPVGKAGSRGRYRGRERRGGRALTEVEEPGALGRAEVGRSAGGAGWSASRGVGPGALGGAGRTERRERSSAGPNPGA